MVYKRFGPGFFVTAAFIGPGTLVTLSLAGARFGFELLWAVLFAIVATMILQEMVVRLTLLSGRTFIQTIGVSFSFGIKKLIALAIVFGCAAFEVGNLTGAALAVQLLFGISLKAAVVFVTVLTALLLTMGRTQRIQQILMAFVFLMSIVFIVIAALANPPILALLKGLFIPRIPPQSAGLLLAVLGTTVVPYNLFLQSEAVKRYWKGGERDLRAAKRDTFLAVFIGGVISGAILVAGGVLGEHLGIVAIANQFQRVLGTPGFYLFCAGLFAAGITSALTAPLAANYVMERKTTWLFVLGVGAICSFFGIKPLKLIVAVQAINSFLLPMLVILLLYFLNVGKRKNKLIHNILGLVILFYISFLCIKSFISLKQSILF